MAMNKAEKAEMEALRNALALSRAMRFPDYPVPQPMTYEEIRASLIDGGLRYGSKQKVARGWFYNAHLGGYGPYSNRVTHGCSDGIYHNPNGDVTTTQGMGRMYRSQEEALQALRHELTTKCAEVLAAVDRAMLSATPSPYGAEELVERAFKDGLAYGSNVEGADPETAWMQSRVRASLGRRALKNQESDRG